LIVLQSGLNSGLIWNGLGIPSWRFLFFDPFGPLVHKAKEHHLKIHLKNIETAKFHIPCSDPTLVYLTYKNQGSSG